LIFKLLPEEIAIHFGVTGKADGYGSPIVAVTVLPIIFLIIHVLCFGITYKFYKGHDQNKKVVELIYWMIPIACIASMASIYAIAFDLPVRISLLFYLLFAVMFIVIGNYLPKCRRNHMMGVKIKWTLANEENWNMTHRFTGKVWFWCGIACLPCMFMPDLYFIYPFIPIMLVVAIAPFLYSYRYYRKQVREGSYTDDGFVPQLSKRAKITVIAMISVMLIGVVVLMFTGNLKYHYGDDAITVEASYYEDLTIDFDDIEKIEYMEDLDLGNRLYGFESFRLAMGLFECQRFGRYTRYTYSGCDAYVILTVNGEKVVLNRPDAAQTKDVYEEISGRLEKWNERN
jgi:uncharacterized membrane protein